MQSELVKTDKFNFVFFENIFTEYELEKIWHELIFLSDKRKFQTARETGGAYKNGKMLKDNRGILLDYVYRERRFSNYLHLYTKPFNSESFKLHCEEDYTLNLFKHTNFDNTLLNYYSDSGYYEAHTDLSCYTYVFWIYKQPKKFTGGDLYFPDIDCTVGIANNCGILFPSWAKHEVKKITLDSDEEYSGRYSFTTFFAISEDREWKGSN